MNINSSEARLGELTRKTFLSMWAYQNPYYTKGKELCDVLVVFGNDVIIMSDKLINFDESARRDVAWKRWYRKAVAGSIRQLRGALGQIRKSPDSIYSDANASAPFPLRLPRVDEARFHLVAIANGTEKICASTFGCPGLRIDTRCSDDQLQLTVGVNYPEFVHVISKSALNAIFDCFDTARDLIDYLERKQEAFLGDTGFLIEGEENLVAAYMLSQKGNRQFRIPHESFPIESDVHVVRSGIWTAYVKSDELRARAKIRNFSYIIDQLIEHIAHEYRKGALLIGQDQAISYHEEHFRLMASESRVGRQLIAAALHDVINEDPRAFWCNISSSLDVAGLIYVWLIYPEVPSSISDEELEHNLLRHLGEYMLVAQAKFRSATRIFGICLPNMASTRTSRIFRVADGEVWTPKMQQIAKELEKRYGILAGLQEFTYGSRRV
ncbi:hypothetical protein [Pseudomonas aeruginosa]|uniref:hypothetical protein n=1 Tax=Pseudomonas aeruginosa TaxID=287 RepID=UPI000FC4306A|nr:hypothetical protein [Pseudomonas aeruginosa]RUB61499.1 hypothetical protein IPC1413_28925 [Pseudomonas aeruginosa]